MISFSFFHSRIELYFSFLLELTFLYFVCDEFYGVWSVLLSLLHELGHLTVLALFQSFPKRIYFSFGGICIGKREKTLTDGKEALVLFGGSLANFLFAAAAYGAGAVPLCALSALLGIWNLFPVRALDGGGLLSLFLFRIMDVSKAFLWERALFFVTGVLLAAGMVFLFFETKNPAFLFFAIYLALRGG